MLKLQHRLTAKSDISNSSH